MNIKKLEFNVFLLWSFFACTASAAEIYHNINGLQVIVWWQPQTLQLAYEYRPRHDIIITNMEARLHDTILSPVSRTDYPYEGVSSAILFLVDISDPRRRRVVTKNAEQIKSMLEKAEPHHKFGLAGFATEMRILARLGTPSSEVAAAADTLQANGRTTELYRHALGAVNLLLKFPARRRALFLFSDGKAEDTTYFHKDIINAANSKNVTIYGFGYATSAANSVHMQSLRRLSEETNGMFIEAEKNFSLPAIFLSAPYRMLDTGEHIIYDLMPAVQGGFYGKQKVRITWH
ncbi:MAG: VWA domain-containing protein, partial [Gammaproteobacteria bacterium]|nr:VWA domain-containing protein [Gammaproteobacteria bacterium]